VVDINNTRNMPALKGAYNTLLEADISTVEGKWVAIIGRKIVRSDPDFSKLFKEVKHDFPKAQPMIIKVPKREILIL